MTVSRRPVLFLLWRGLKTISGVTVIYMRMRAELRRRGVNAQIVLANPHVDPRDWGEADHVVKTPRDLTRLLLGMGAADVVILCESSFVRYMAAAEQARRAGADLRIFADIQSDHYLQFYRWIPITAAFVDCYLGASQKISDVAKAMVPTGRGTLVMPLRRGVVPAAMRIEYKVQPIRLIYTGRLDQEQKRVLEFVPLVEELDRLGVNYTMQLVGEGSQKHKLQQLLKHQISKGAVTFLGYRTSDDTQRLCRESDVFINLSGYEGLCQSMLEAMAQGCVPVVTDVSGVAEVIKADVNGYMFPIGQPQQMAHQVALLATDSARLATIGRAAQATIGTGITMSQTIDEFEAIRSRLAIYGGIGGTRMRNWQWRCKTWQVEVGYQWRRLRWSKLVGYASDRLPLALSR